MADAEQIYRDHPTDEEIADVLAARARRPSRPPSRPPSRRLSASADFAGIDARTAASRLTVPVLYVAATGDSRYPEVAKTLYAATKSKRSLTMVPGALHGVEFVQEPGVPALRGTVDAFISAHAR